MEKIAIYSDNHMNYINKLRGVIIIIIIIIIIIV